MVNDIPLQSDPGSKGTVQSLGSSVTAMTSSTAITNVAINFLMNGSMSQLLSAITVL